MVRSRKGSSRTRRSPKPKPTFRSRVPAELVDQLLYHFVALVKQGLELMLQTPSVLARDEFDQHPDWAYGSADIPRLVTWTAQGAYELAWPAFCQHVLGHLDWQALPGVQTQADLDALAAGFGQVQMRCIELAIHDALKAGDKCDTRPADQRPTVQEEFAQSIGASQALKLLKKQLRPLLERLDAQDPPHPPHRPRDYRSRSFVLADPNADLATDALCILRRPSPWHKALFRSRTVVERTNSRSSCSSTSRITRTAAGTRSSTVRSSLRLRC